MLTILEHARGSNVNRKAKFAENCGKLSKISPVVLLALTFIFLFSFTSKLEWVSGRRRQNGKIPSKRTWNQKINIKVLLKVNAWLQYTNELILLILIKLLS